MRYAIIDPKLSQRNIINVVEWEGAEWLPPRNTVIMPCPNANCGDTYNFDTKEFIRENDVIESDPK